MGDWEALPREMERLSKLCVCAKKWDKDAILRGLMALKLCNLFFSKLGASPPIFVLSI